MKEEDIIWIERYLDSKLSEEESLKFAQRLEKDKEFSDLYHYIKDVRQIIVFDEKKNLSEKLNKIADDYQSTSTGKTKVRKFFTDNTYLNYFALAASVTAVILSVAFFIFKSPKQKADVYANDLEYIHHFKSTSPDKVKSTEARLKNYDEYKYFGSTPDGDSFITPQHNAIKGIVYLNDSKYDNHYYLSDTLFLFGDFDESTLVFYLQDSLSHKESIVLKSGLQKFIFDLKKTDKITPLQAWESDSIKKL